MKSLEHRLKQIQIALFTSMYEFKFDKVKLTTIIEEIIDEAREEGKQYAINSERDKIYRTFYK